MILVTDLDATIVGDDDSMNKFFDIIQRLRSEHKVKLVYATGRTYRNYLGLKEEKKLLEPDGVISGVGAELVIGGELNVDWNNLLLGEWDEAEAHRIKNLLPDYELQPDDYQGPNRIALESKKDNPDYSLATSNILNVLVSHNGEYVDILTKSADKGRALLFLLDLWGESLNDVIGAGDSMNDLSFLRLTRAILVGNSYEEIIRWYKENPDREVYVSNKTYAAGIIDGLENYGVLVT